MNKKSDPIESGLKGNVCERKRRLELLAEIRQAMEQCGADSAGELLNARFETLNDEFDKHLTELQEEF